MMTAKQQAALIQLTEHAAQVGRWCGFTLLRDDLHGSWLHRMINAKEDFTLQAHRGSYKTTCLSVALAVLLVTHPRENIIFLRKTDADVVEIIKQVQMLLLHPSFQVLTATLYAGEPVKIVRSNSTEITTDCFAAPRGSAQLLGIGIGGSLTGKHADIIVTDDIINLRDRQSQAERDRTKAAYMELQNVRNPGGRIINTGTPWHPDDAFSLMPEPIRFDCYSTGLLTAEKLEQLRQSMDPSLYAANYELQHIASGTALFATRPPMTQDEAMLYDGIAHIDAAYGGEDFTAFTCGRRDGDTIYLYGRLLQRHVDTVLDAILADCDRLRCQPVHMETNADKGYLFRELRRRGVSGHPYPEKMNKYYKISTFLRKWWGNVVVLEGTDPEYINQILAYNEEASHDDAPDSAACICRALDRRE